MRLLVLLLSIAPTAVMAGWFAAPDGASTLPDQPASFAIPPTVAARAGVSVEKQQQIAEMTQEANAQLEALRWYHRKAQKSLEALLRTNQPSDDEVVAQLENVGAAETAIRKNRVQLMLRIRKLLGPKVWTSLQSELEAEQQLAQRRPEEGAATIGEGVQTVPVGGTLPPSKK